MLLCAATLAQAAPITTLYNTGVDNSGALLAPGATDSHYSVSVGSGPFVLSNATALSFAWAGNTASSQWLGNTASGSGPSTIYTTTFDLTGFDHTTAQIAVSRLLADDGTIVKLNGVQVFDYSFPANPAPWFNPAAFNITTNFQAGINTLTFDTPNTSGPGGALQVQMTGSERRARTRQHGPCPDRRHPERRPRHRAPPPEPGRCE